MALWWHKLLFFLVSRCVVCVRGYMRSHVCVLCLWTLEVGLSSLLHVALSFFVEKGLPAQLLTLDSVSQGSLSAFQTLELQEDPMPIRHLHGFRGPELWSSHWLLTQQVL